MTDEHAEQHRATTVIPAASGFELLSLECAGEVMRRPIVGWAVTVGPGLRVGSIAPSALGLAGSPLAFGDEGYAIALPDGRALAMDASSRFYKDATWAKAVNKDLATQARE